MKRRMPGWLSDAVIYQIYPQSFSDSNGDGIGDLQGVIARLDYIQWLGVKAIWLNPFFASPFNDAGYDITDYYQIAPRYGTLADFQQLCQEAHRGGLKVIFDLVFGHCSWENAWFQASCQEERNPYSDWFIWTNSVWAPAPPGLEIIRGYAPRMGGYLTNFFVSQPAFNFGFAHPDPRYPWQQPVDAPGPQAVRRAMKNVIRYWFEQGADGFRADMALSLVKGDLDGGATAAVWQEIHQWLEAEYPEHVMIAEGGNPAVSIARGGFHIDFCLPWRMPTYNSLFRKTSGNEGGSPTGVDSYGFSVFDGMGHGNIREFMDEYLRHYYQTRDYGHIAIPEGNHDLPPRIRSGRSEAEVLQVYLFTMTMPGVPFLYYGDEIGMRDQPDLPSREGSHERSSVRTPMQWDDSPNAGFSTAAPEKLYLPIDPHSDRPTVAALQGDPASLLNQTRRLIELHRTQPALRAEAAFELLYAERGRLPLVYQRQAENQRLVIAINPSLQPVSAKLSLPGIATLPQTIWGQPEALTQIDSGWQIELPPAAGGIYQVS
jgi:maltose alpha-D-glucosyltransferase/alpha-amylase